MILRKRPFFATPGFVALIAAAILVGAAAWSWLSIQEKKRKSDLDGGEPALSALSSAGDLPVLGEVPAFSFIDSNGEAFESSRLAGAPWVADFIFTTCAGICPLMSAQMARLQDSVPADSPVRFLSVTVDPGHDTPEVLSEYAARFQADTERWYFLTGEPAEIYKLAEHGFHLGAGELPDFDPELDDGPFFHSGRMALVDENGRIRGYYEGTDSEQVDRLRADLDRLFR